MTIQKLSYFLFSLFLLVLHLKSEAQNNQLVQTKFGEVKVNYNLINQDLFYAGSFQDLKNMYNKFTRSDAKSDTNPTDSVEIFHTVACCYKDSLKENMKNISFTYVGQNEIAIELLVFRRQASGKAEKVVTTGPNSFINSYCLTNYYSFYGVNEPVVMSKCYEYHFKTVNNQIIQIDVFETTNSTDTSRNIPRHFSKRMVIDYDNKTGMPMIQKFYSDTLKSHEICHTFVYGSNSELKRFICLNFPKGSSTYSVFGSQVISYFYDKGNITYQVISSIEDSIPNKEQLDSVYLQLEINMAAKREFENAKNYEKPDDNKSKELKFKLDSIENLLNDIKIKYFKYDIERYVYENGRLANIDKLKLTYGEFEHIIKIHSLFYNKEGKIIKWTGQYYATIYEYDLKTGKLLNKKEFLDKDRTNIRIEECYSYFSTGKMAEILIIDYPNDNEKSLRFKYSD